MKMIVRMKGLKITILEGNIKYLIKRYHPVHIGEVLMGRYVIIQKLGWGHFSTVWLARDFKFETYVALKIQKSAPHYLEAAYDEVEILQKVAREAHNPEWLKSLQEYYQDVFIIFKNLYSLNRKKYSQEMIVKLYNY